MAKDTVDTRVVRMEFDNKQFEKNIKQTSKSLDKFKQDLDFKGVGDSLDKVKVKFSALQVATTTFVVSLTNKLIQLGTILVKSLSVDNISSGWAKFGEKTTSVATMMAQKIRIAGKEITDLARKTEIVNEQLEMLTWFSDETSYSFTDMVNNVGKFIAAGQDLDVSVKAMEGIATWAAKAGQNTQTASRAMYQLAQAMGKGKIQKIDWMSIQNANMDTEDFRETILATAIALGELSKEGDKFVTKTGKKFTQSQFADFLSEGWFTSDVLVKGLEKYSAAVEQIYEIANREGITAAEVMEKYADQLDEFGLAAFKASQQARTLSDALNSVRDAVSTKWMKTFESIFGNQEEATSLWSSLADELYDVFAESGNFRNNILDVWKELGGREDIFGKHGEPNQGAFWNLYDAIIAVRDLIKKAWNTVFPISQMEKASDQVDDISRRLKELTQRIKDFTYSLKISEEFGSRISKIFQVIFNILKGSLIVLKTIRFIIDPIIELGKQLVNKVLDQIIYSTNKLVKAGENFESFAVKLQTMVANLVDSLNAPAVFDEVFDFIKDTFAILENLHPIESLIGFIEEFRQAFEEAGGTSENFKKIINSVLSVIKLVRKAIVSIAMALTKTIVPILDDVIEVLSKLAGFILGTAVKVVSIIADLITSINEALQGNANAKEFKDQIFGILEQLGNLAKSLVPIVGSLVKIVLKLVEALLLIPRMLNEVSKRLTGKGILENLESLFDGIVNIISDFVNGIKRAQSKPGSLSGLFGALVSVIEGLWEVIKGLLSIAQLVFTVLGSALKKIGLAIQYMADIFIKVFSGRAKELTSAEKKMLGVIAALAVLAIIGVTLYNMIWLIIAVFKPTKVLADSLSGLMDSIAWKFKLGIFESFANALLKFSVSIVLLAGLNTDAMYKALAVLATFAVIIGLFAIVLTNMSSGVMTFTKQIIKVGSNMASNTQYNDLLRQISVFINSFARAMIKISLALAILSGISSEGLSRGLMVLLATFGMIAMLFNTIENFSKLSIDISMLKEFRKVMTTTAITLLLVAIAFKQLAGLSSDQMTTVILGYSAFMLGVLLLLNAIDNIKNVDNVKDVMKSLLMISALLIAMALSVKILAAIEPGPLWIAVAAIAVLLTLFTAAIAVINKTSKSIKINETTGAFQKYAGIAVLLGALAVTILAVAASILMLSTVPWYRLLSSVIAMALVLAAMVAAVIVMNKSINHKKLSSVAKTLLVMGGISAMMVSMASVLMLLSLIPWYRMISATLGMAAMLTMFIAAIIVINKAISSKKMASVAKTLLVMAGLANTMLIMSVSLIILASVPWYKLIAPVIAMTALLAAFTAAIRFILIDDQGSSINKARNIVIVLGALAATIATMGAVMIALAFVPWYSLLVSTFAMTTLLAAFTAAIRFILADGKGSSINKARNIVIVLGALAATIATMGAVMIALAFVPWYSLLASTLAMTALLAAFVAALLIINKSINHKKMSSIAKTLLVMGAIVTSIVVFASMLKMLANVPWQNILVSTAAIIAVMIAMTTIVFLLNEMAKGNDSANSLLKIAAAFAILSASMLLLAGAIKIFSEISIADIGKGFLVMAGAIIVLALAAKLFNALIPAMAAIAGILMLIGMSTLAAGIGLRVMAESLTMMNQDFTPALEALTGVMSGLLSTITNSLGNLLPQIIDVITKITGALIDQLTELTPKILGLIGTILEGTINLLNEYAVPLIEVTVKIVAAILDGVLYLLDTYGPHIIETVVTLLNTLVRAIADHMDALSQSLMDIIKSILSTLEENIGDIVNLLAGIVVGLLDGLRKNIGPIVKALVDFLIEATVALFENIGPLLDTVIDYVFDFIARVIVALTGKVIALAGLITKVVLIILAAVIRLTIASLGALSKLFITFVASILLLLVYTFMGLTNVLLEVFKVIVKESLRVLVDAIIWAQDVFVAIGKMMVNLILRGIIMTFLAMAGWLLDLIDFIFGTNIRDSVQAAADNLANESRDMVNNIAAGTDQVQAAITNASNNIGDVINMTAQSANEAVSDGMSQIGDVVSDSMDQLGDAMQQFGEDAGQNLYQGMGDSSNIDGANQVGQDMGDATAEGFAEATETHSPSRLFARFGSFLMEGLGLGIQNGATATENAMAEVISDSLQLATDILDGQEGDDYTIKVGMDISSVEAQTSKIQDMMSGVNNPDITATGKNAGYNAKALERNNSKGSDTVNNDNSTTVTYNNVFNIESTDPQQSADEIDKVLKEQNTRFKLAHGT